MSKVLSYKEIKKELLKDTNILKVNINSTKNIISIKPIQNKSFFNFKDVLKDYSNIYDNIINIGGRNFKITNKDYCNTTIYSFNLKEINI